MKGQCQECSHSQMKTQGTTILYVCKERPPSVVVAPDAAGQLKFHSVFPMMSPSDNCSRFRSAL